MRNSIPQWGDEDMKRLEDIQDALYQAAKTDRKRKFCTLHDKVFLTGFFFFLSHTPFAI